MELTPAQRIFQAIVDAWDDNPIWEGSRAQGLFDAFLIATGLDHNSAMEQLGEALEEKRQRQHEESLDAAGGLHA